MRDSVGTYIADVVIRDIQGFIDTLNVISPLIDGWSVSNPVSAHRIMQLTGRRFRIASYRDFSIPKRSGGERLISAPVGLLKQVQAAINVLLQTLFQPSVHANGFIIGKNIRDNALPHVGQTCIYNIDIENFFPSITKEMVRRAIHSEMADRIQSKEVITVISNVCTLPVGNGTEVLPQGAPTSPVISNIVLKRFDRQMSRLAEKYGCRYSRYADDITFSHSKEARRMNTSLLEAINKTIGQHGLKINAGKTSLLTPGQRMEVTGIVVNEKTNVPRSYIRQLRTLLHLWKKYGYRHAQQIYTDDFCHGIKKDLCRVIEGKINYLEMVKGKDDLTLRHYRQRLKTLKFNTF